MEVPGDTGLLGMGVEGGKVGRQGPGAPDQGSRGGALPLSFPLTGFDPTGLRPAPPLTGTHKSEVAFYQGGSSSPSTAPG